MQKFLKSRGFDVAIASITLTVLTTTPAWAGVTIPAPAAAILAGGAIIGAIVVAKLWRRK